MRPFTSTRRHLVEQVPGERPGRQRVPPVVEVADDQGRQVGRLAEQVVLQEVSDLPVAFALGQAEVPVDQVQGPLRRLHDHALGAARLLVPQPQRELVLAAVRPARQR